MFTDLAGFTARAHEDEAGALQLLREQDTVFQPVLEAHAGRQVKAIGDGRLIEFPNALDAVECAVDLQRRLHETDSSRSGPGLPMRVGIHLGDVQGVGSDILGDAVNIASRIEPLAEPGGICVSSHVYDQIRNKVPYQFRMLDSKALKGIRDPIGVYKIVLPWNAPRSPRSDSEAPRLAVLPLTNISPDPHDEYFADGLTEELIAVLSRVHGLRVIARTSVSQYKTAPKPVRQIGSELGVDAVLEGSVRRAGNRLRITLQLIDASTEDHRWAEKYDRELDDVFEIQAEVAEKTAGALRLELLGSERDSLRRTPTHDLEAYDLYLRGIAAFQRTADEGWTRPGVEGAVRYFDAAIARDPTSSLFHSYLANVLIAAAGESIPQAEVQSRVPQLVARALELDPEESDAHTASGNLALQFELNWERAEHEFRSAIRLNPSNMSAHAWYGILLATLGRFSEAHAEFDAAIALDPLFRQLRGWQVRAFEYEGRFSEAIELAKRTLERDPGSRTMHIHLGRLYCRVGQIEDARREAKLAGGLIAGSAAAVARGLFLAMLGEPEEAQQLVTEWESGSATRYFRPSYVAALLTQLGRKEEALEILERDDLRGDRGLWIDFRRMEFDPIRNDPRFVAILREMKLAP